MPINVQIIRTGYPHWGSHSGFNRFLTYLDPSKYRVKTRCVSDSDADFPIPNKMFRNAVKLFVHQGKMKWYKLSDLTAEAGLLLRCLRSNPPHMIHYLDGEHSARFLPTLFQAFPGKRPGIVATFHQPPDIIDDLIDPKIIGRMDVIHVVSPDQAAYFSRFVDENRVKMILHGIDTDFFQPKKHRHSAEKFSCLTVGHYLRDFNLLRRICQRLSYRPDIKFKVVGSRFKGLDELPNVRVYQGIDDDALRKLYRESSLLLLPMRYATANNALLEGIACGLPVVANHLPGLEAYVPGREALLVKKRGVDGFVTAILKVAEDPKCRRLMAAAARQRALELDWRRITPLFQNMYDELIYGKREKAAG